MKMKHPLCTKDDEFHFEAELWPPCPTSKKERSVHILSTVILDKYMHDCELEKKTYFSALDGLLRFYEQEVNSRILWPKEDIDQKKKIEDAGVDFNEFLTTIERKGNKALSLILTQPYFSSAEGASCWTQELSVFFSAQVDRFEQICRHDFLAYEIKIVETFNRLERTKISRQFFKINDISTSEEYIRKTSRILELPVEAWGKKAGSPRKYQDSKCSVCLRKYKKKTACVILPCGHEFHIRCAYTWLFLHPNCPMCKAEVDLRY